MARRLEDVRGEGDVQIGERTAELHAFRREMPPRRGRELHHRHERLQRGGTHEQLLVNLAADKRRLEAATHHVRKRIWAADKPRRDNLRHDRVL